MLHGPTVTVCSSPYAMDDAASDAARERAADLRIVPSLGLVGALSLGSFTASALRAGRGRGSGTLPAFPAPAGTWAAAAAAFLAKSAAVSAGSSTSHWQIL